MSKAIIATLLATAATVWALPGMAQNAPQAKDAKAQPGVQGTSQYSPMLPVASNTAGSEPIDKALAVLIPGDHTVKLSNRIPSTTRLTWRADPNWVNVLSEALTKAGLTASYDPKTKEVNVYQQPPKN
jgi:hypothetical protein